MQSFRVSSVPALNQPANFAAVATEGQESIYESRPTDIRRYTRIRRIEADVHWILRGNRRVLQNRFQRIGSSGSAGECNRRVEGGREGGREVSARQGVRNGRGEAEIGRQRETCARVYTHTRVLHARRGEARGRPVRRRARERKPSAGGGGADGGARGGRRNGSLNFSNN